MSVKQYETMRARIEALEKELAAERLAREGAQEHRRQAEERLREATDRNLHLLARAEKAEAEAQRLYCESWGVAVKVAEVREVLEQEAFSADVVRNAQELARQMRERAETAEERAGIADLISSKVPVLEQDISTLKALLAGETREREQAERELEDARENERKAQALCSTAMSTAERYKQERDDEKAARERAEAERDTADKRALEMCAVQEAEMQARIRAEADNAALLDALQTSRDPHACGSCGTRPSDCTCGVLALLDAAHPGAARLEELRALREVRQACEPYRAAEARLPQDEQDAEGRALVDACAKADALKGGGA